MQQINQQIRYLRTSDGVRLAWADAGKGTPLIKAANWLSHLEFDWESPIWRHWMQFFSEHYRFVRHDERGSGMTDWNVKELSLEMWAKDLELVIEAAKPQEPVVLLGISQGAATCIAYAVKYPERVSHLVLYGGYARGVYMRGDTEKERFYKAMVDLVRVGWGSDNHTFRQVFTSRFAPEAKREQLGWYNELCAKTTSPEMAVRLLESRATVDVTGLLTKIRTPTLVLHSRDDEVVPIAESRILASEIANAQFVELDSRNHVLLKDEPAWARFCEEVLNFTGSVQKQSDKLGLFATLTPREQEILKILAEGLSNTQIADRLAISEKTVRNHISNLYRKLSVYSRSQAIVLAREQGWH